MSNYLAIATVTAALYQIVKTAAEDAMESQVNVDIGRPSTSGNDDAQRKISLYLYQITPSAALRNADLPTRDSKGNLRQRPQIALDLHYLLAFYGNGLALEPERMLGAVVRDLHTCPLLTKQAIQDAITSNSPQLENSDLATAVESVKLTPAVLSLDELSKLWSVFFQTPYALSVVYQASVVLIEADVTPAIAMPVREPGVYGTPFTPPVIEHVKAEEAVPAHGGPSSLEEPIYPDSILIIEGKALKSEDSMVLLDGEDVTAHVVSVTDTRISVALAATGLRAGAHSVQVVHRMALGTTELHKIIESNIVAFLLRPVIQVPGNTDNALTISFTPRVGKEQRVSLFLYEITTREDPPPRSYLIKAPVNNDITDENQEVTASITFATDTVKDGIYSVRVQVDGAESVLKLGADGRYTEPKVDKP